MLTSFGEPQDQGGEYQTNEQLLRLDLVFEDERDSVVKDKAPQNPGHVLESAHWFVLFFVVLVLFLFVNFLVNIVHLLSDAPLHFHFLLFLLKGCLGDFIGLYRLSLFFAFNLTKKRLTLLLQLFIFLAFLVGHEGDVDEVEGEEDESQGDVHFFVEDRDSCQIKSTCNVEPQRHQGFSQV